MGITQVFVYLQLLDLITTLVGFKLGASEASPFVRMLMHGGAATGVFASKLLPSVSARFACTTRKII